VSKNIALQLGDMNSARSYHCSIYADRGYYVFGGHGAYFMKHCAEVLENGVFT
jgi:hypothetical protein